MAKQQSLIHLAIEHFLLSFSLLTDKGQPLVTVLGLPGISGTSPTFPSPANIQTVLPAPPVVRWVVAVVGESQRASITPVESPSGISLSSNPKPLVSLTDSVSNELVLRVRMYRS